MFGTYLRRELRRRARQSSIIALGLALGIGLVITVTALSSGVKNAQSSVLHSLYGMDTDITVTQAPASGSGGARGFGFAGGFGNGQNGRPKAGTKVSVDNLSSTGLGSLTAANVSSVGKMSDVAAVAGGLTLSDTKLTITIPNLPHDFTFRPDFVNQNGPRIVQDVDGDFSIQARVMEVDIELHEEPFQYWRKYEGRRAR